MGIFDQRRKTRRPQGDSNGSALDQLQDLSAEVPEVEDTLARIDQALKKKSPCGCWG